MTGGAAPRGDFHNHLVPGVDDGSRNLDDSLEGVERMVAAGFTRIITTPHLDASTLRHDPAGAEDYLDLVTRGYQTLKERAAPRFPALDLRRGHEVRLDVPECDFQDPRLRLGETSFVLVEWPRFQIPPETVPVLTRLREQGVRPIVAHPERYAGVERDLGLMSQWRRAGAFLQVNYGSLVGRYGANVRSAAFALLREGVVDYFSTDFHGRPEYQLFAYEAAEKLEEAGAAELLHTLSVTNPERLFNDEAPVATVRLPGSSGFWGKVRELFH